jgi:signal transduction histidine kinase
VAALRNEAERTRRKSGAAVVERIRDLPGGLPRDTATALFRIAQEALRNAARHGRPKTIELSLEPDAGRVRLTVRDDGAGFDAAADAYRRGLGLYSMRERARQLDGSLDIRSRPGAGTTVVASLPLKTHRS